MNLSNLYDTPQHYLKEWITTKQIQLTALFHILAIVCITIGRIVDKKPEMSIIPYI